MTRIEINNDYFDWMYNLVCDHRFSKNNSFRSLLIYLHNREFTYRLASDSDRAHDGVEIRRRFALSYDSRDYKRIVKYLDGPCSVLEMMIALSIRCEESIMDDPAVGDRTGQWFWKMIVNLGLGSMIDSRFDSKFVDKVITDFLNRKYEPDGHGGLFIIRNRKDDLRSVSIWTQMMWFLDTML